MDFSPPAQPDGKPSREQVLARISAVLSGTPQFFEWQHRRADGTRFDTEVTLNRIDLADRCYVLGIVRDITERKQAVQALQESERNYRHLFEGLNDAAFVTESESGRIVATNRQGEALLGRARHQIVGMHYSELHPHNRAEECRRKFVAHADEGGGVEYDVEVIRKDGTVVPVTVSAATMTMGERKLILGLFRDNTDRKRAEQALQESERFLADVFESIQDGISVLDPDLTVRRVNGVMKRWYAKNLPLEGKKCYECYHDHDEACDPCPTLRCVQSGRTECEVVPGLPGSPVEWVELFSYPILDKGSGTVTGIVEFVRDITARKRAEEELARHREHLEELVEQRTRQLEESREQIRRTEHLASLGTLAAGIAHEINNPVGGILLAAENALEAKAGPEAGDVIEACLRDVAEQARRCGGVIQNVLRFAKQETTEKQPGSLNPVVEQAVMVTRKYAEEHAATVELELARDLPPLWFNPLEMEQVFVNLIHNAAGPGAGGVTVLIRTEFTGETVRATVQDNGAGIAPEQLKHVFDPFFTSRREQGGTGLGLSIVHGIVTAHGGTINVRSRPGRGTTFTIDLPPATPDNKKEAGHA